MKRQHSEQHSEQHKDSAHHNPSARADIEGLKVAFTLPNLASYRDRVRLTLELSELEGVARLYLLTPQGQEERSLPQGPHLTVITLPRARYAQHASRWIRERVELGALDVAHDTFGHFTSAFEQLKGQALKGERLKKLNTALITTLYTINWAWFERVRPLGFDLNLRYAALRLSSLWLDDRLSKVADRVLVLGEGHELDVMRGHRLSIDHITLIPSEVDVERFSPPPLDAERSGLLYTGALSRNKGVDLLLTLFDELAPRYPTLTLTLIGRTPPFERAWLEGALERCEARERVVCLSQLPQDELIAHYQRAALYMFPSLFEGSPRSLREALACGCPAIASEIPGCRGLDPKAEALRFAPPSDLNAWRAALIEALEEPAEAHKRRSQKSVERMREHHSPKVVARALLSVYREVLSELRG